MKNVQSVEPNKMGGTISKEQHIWLNGIKDELVKCQNSIENASKSKTPQFAMGQIHVRLKHVMTALDLIRNDLQEQNKSESDKLQ